MHSAASPSIAVGTADTASLSTRLGIVGLAMGLVAILILCVPILGYVSLGLCGMGMMLGVAGLYSARKDGVRQADCAGGVEELNPLGNRELNYPLGAILVCLLVTTLTLLPFLLR